MKKKSKEYEGGTVDMWSEISGLCYSKVKNMIMGLGYKNEGKIFYREKGLSLINGLREFENDHCLAEIEQTVDFNGFVTFFVVHDYELVDEENDAEEERLPIDDDDDPYSFLWDNDAYIYEMDQIGNQSTSTSLPSTDQAPEIGPLPTFEPNTNEGPNAHPSSVNVNHNPTPTTQQKKETNQTPCQKH